jgi:Mg-chelatase subunit ChlD
MADPGAADAAARWRLVLGRHAEQPLGAQPGDERGPADERDRVLEFLYDREHAARGHRAGGGQSGVLSTVAWLKGARTLFPREAVEVLERDALVRYGLTELVTDPALLRTLEPSIELVGAILAFRERMTPEVLVEARRIVREVVAALSGKLRKDCEPALFGANTPSRSRPLRTVRNADWMRTIRRNLRRWDPERKRLSVDHLSYRHRQRTRPAWRIVLAVDQSGSMLEALVHASVTAAILAAVPAVTVHLLLWDHRVVDLSSQVNDPLDVLLSAQLGGGTSLYPALRAAADLVTVPERTVIAVVSDFHVYDPPEPSLALAGELVAEGVRCFGFCALTDGAAASYDERFARRLAEAGWWVGAVTPRSLVEAIGRLLS